jgi:hypothetical protein
MDELKFNLHTLEKLPGFVDIVDPSGSPIFNHLLEQYDVQVDELLASEPQYTPSSNNLGVCKLKSWT